MKKLEKKARLLAAQIRRGTITRKEADAKMARYRARLNESEKRSALRYRPRTSGASRLTNADFIKAAEEKRSLTLAKNGALNQVQELIKAIIDKDEILSFARYFYGPNASTTIPVLSPRPALPAGQSEGASGIASDSTAQMGTTEIQPMIYFAELPVTYEALKLNSINLESELPEIFREAFQAAMHEGMLVGTGSGKEMKGIFVSAKDNASGQTAISGAKPTISELAALALTLAGLNGNYDLVMHPSIYADILSDATDSEDVKLYKESLIRDKKIEGINVRLDNNAPSAKSSGAVLVAGVPLDRYAIGVAGEVEIRPVTKTGDTQTYFHALMPFSGKAILDGDIYSLVVA